MHTFIKRTGAMLLGFSLLTGSALADLTLNNDFSSLHFASTKKEIISEVHTFKQLQGSISDEGVATLEIDLTSVDTKIDIRNERMLKHLFETDQFASATITVDLGEAGLKPGVRDITATLNLHGVEQEVPANVTVMDNGDSMAVISNAPVMISTTAFELDGGLAMLQKLASLSSINKAVPVTFLLNFSK